MWLFVNITIGSEFKTLSSCRHSAPAADSVGHYWMETDHLEDSIRLNVCILLTAVSRQINSSAIITARASQLIREREQLCLCLGVIIT